jgi:hypothetical protein
LDASEFKDGGQWPWESSDKTLELEGRFLRNEAIRLSGLAAEIRCDVVRVTVKNRVREGLSRREQRRDLWLAKDIGIVRELSTTVVTDPLGVRRETLADVWLRSLPALETDRSVSTEAPQGSTLPKEPK